MPLMKTLSTDVADGSTTFPWQGRVYEILPFDAMIQVAVLADTGDTFTATVISGTDVLMGPADQIDNLATTTPITFPQDYQLQDVAAAGERLVCEVTNQSGGVATFRTCVMITPV